METLNLNPDAAVALVASRTKKLVVSAGRRVAVGLVGGPGVGKSTIAAELVRVLNLEVATFAALVPMDGFHMRQKKLEELGLADKKGAAETFEATAFAAFLMRVKGTKRAAHGPGYSRETEDVVDDAYTIAPDAKVLVTEGNYLLLPEPPWGLVRPLLDLAIFINVPRGKVGARLMRRHAEHGRFTEKHIRGHVSRIDLPNYDLVTRTRERADIAIDLETAV